MKNISNLKNHFISVPFIIILIMGFASVGRAACTTKDLCVSQVKNDLYICGNDYCMSIANAPKQYADSIPRTADEAAKLFNWRKQSPEQIQIVKNLKATINYKQLYVAPDPRWPSKTDRPVYYIVWIGNTAIVGAKVKDVRADIGEPCNKLIVKKQGSRYKYRGIHKNGKQYAVICG